MTVHTLSDGSMVEVREMRPCDQTAVRAAFHELSPESRYQRFLAHTGELSDEMWRHLCDVDGRDHVAFVAVTEHGARVVGVARFVRLALDPSVAEFAATVADAWQRRGLGSLLFDALATAAHARGVQTFAAYALAQNVAVRHLMSRFGSLERRHLGDEQVLWLRLKPEEKRLIA